jgi:hypothetical protein
MRRFLNNLFRTILTTSKASERNHSTRRARLQLHGLEDRMVLSSAATVGNILSIGVSAGVSPAQVRTLTLTELNAASKNPLIKVSDNVQGVLGQFPINQIATYEIAVNGNDNVTINDSQGFPTAPLPFANGSNIILISPQGAAGGTNNSFTLDGNVPLPSSILETYTASPTSAAASTLAVDGLNFRISSAISAVTDTIPLQGGGVLVVNASGSQNVTLTPQILADTQTLSGLGGGGGSTLTYANKNFIKLNESAPSVTVTVNAPFATILEEGISVNTSGVGDDVVVAAAGVVTSVVTKGSGSEVLVQSNAAQVNVEGDSSTNPTTTVVIGKSLGNNTDVTSGIQANVLVIDAKTLDVANNGNDSTQEKVTVTQQSISGTGFFGNSSVVVNYGGVGVVNISGGQLANTYTVEASSLNASFGSQINLNDDSDKFFAVNVDVDARSGLDLDVIKRTLQATGEININAPAGKFTNQSDGDILVSFAGGLTSQIDNDGFTVSEEHS